MGVINTFLQLFLLHLINQYLQHFLESCMVEGEEYDHNEDFIHPVDPCQVCKCKVRSITDNVL